MYGTQTLDFLGRTRTCNLFFVAEAKKEAEVAKEREVALWQEALKTGEQVHPLTEETLNKHMQGPIIIEDERNAQSVSQPPSNLSAE